MHFNSFAFGFFLLFSNLLYWMVFNRSKRIRNLFLLFASWFFYGSWDWRFLFLIIVITLTDYFFGKLIHVAETSKRRNALLMTVVIINLSILFWFKYYNFFVASANAVLGMMGIIGCLRTVDIIIPVGISFFTFQGLGYVIDIYRKQSEPVNDIIAFSAFIAFFPQLVAGPIERAKDLLPQFIEEINRKPFVYDHVRHGLLLIAVGLFKKMVIADRLAIYVDAVYVNPIKGLPTLTALAFFCFQLYLDFSAYSQIAIGTAQVFGFRLSTNFRRPYLATTFREFWSRWHISISSWFRDYLYISLGGNRHGVSRTIINTMIVFIVSGIWHGSSWNYVIWGAMNGLALIIFDRRLKIGIKRSLMRYASVFFIVFYWAISLVFFRAPTFHDAISMLGNIGFGNADLLYSMGMPKIEYLFTIFSLVVLMLIELIEETWNEKLDSFLFNSSWIVRWIPYMAIVLGIVYLGIYGNGSDNNFIYFQF